MPTLILRPDGNLGYLKCTLRSVQMMRAWMELFYPILVAQEGFYEKDGTYRHWMQEVFFNNFMEERIGALENLYDNVEWRKIFEFTETPAVRDLEIVKP